ncbi:MAG: flagellar hook-basal body complex protein FliE [Planctomycetota bacterium]|jgi:flagellar hook-basal body complex protein FliE
MTDPLGLIGNMPPAAPPAARGAGGAGPADGPSFKAFLKDQLEQVNALQEDAKEAVEDLATGRRDDLEGVILATQKADTAFRMLLAVRNKVMDAYQEVKELRV